MFTPNFSPNQYLDAVTTDAAFNQVSGNFTIAMGATFLPGLISPTSMSYSTSALSMTFSLPAPFGVLFGNGVLSQAHGTASNTDTQSYTISFSGVQPASGSVTGYVVASYMQIGQNPIQIVGPPAGNPGYDPNFTPITASSTETDSFSLSVTTSPPNNSTTFELARAVVYAGSTVVSPTSQYVQPAQTNPAYRNVNTATSTALTTGNAGIINYLTSGNTTATLPAASGSVGLPYTVVSVSGGTLVTSAGNVIYGAWPSTTAGVSGLSLQAGDLVTVISNGFNWNIHNATLAAMGVAPGLYGVDIGTVNSLVVNLVPAPGALTPLVGQPILVKVANTNTAATVCNLNGNAGITVVTEAGAALVSGQLVAGGIYVMVYDGSRLQLVSGAVNNVLGYQGDVTLANLVAGGVAPLASPQFTGEPTITDSSGSSIATLTVTAASDANGANIRLVGPSGSVKTIRSISNQLQVINAAYSASVVSIDDNGNITAGSLATGGNISTSTYLMASRGAYGTEDGTVAVTLYDFGHNAFNGNGYQILPNGLILQWGTQGTSNLTATVTFPLTFPNGVLWASMLTEAAGVDGNWGIGAPDIQCTAAGSLSSSGFEFFSLVWVGDGWSGQSSTSIATSNWIAIGY